MSDSCCSAAFRPVPDLSAIFCQMKQNVRLMVDSSLHPSLNSLVSARVRIIDFYRKGAKQKREVLCFTILYLRYSVVSLAPGRGGILVARGK